MELTRAAHEVQEPRASTGLPRDSQSTEKGYQAWCHQCPPSWVIRALESSLPLCKALGTGLGGGCPHVSFGGAGGHAQPPPTCSTTKSQPDSIYTWVIRKFGGALSDQGSESH